MSTHRLAALAFAVVFTACGGIEGEESVASDEVSRCTTTPIATLGIRGTTSTQYAVPRTSCSQTTIEVVAYDASLELSADGWEVSGIREGTSITHVYFRRASPYTRLASRKYNSAPMPHKVVHAHLDMTTSTHSRTSARGGDTLFRIHGTNAPW